MARIIKFLFCILFIVSSLVYTDIVYSNINNRKYIEYSPGSILSFVNNLISKDEYYRAFTELKRLESYYPGFIEPNKIFVTELYLLYKGKQYSEIKEYNLSISSKDIFNDSINDISVINNIFLADAFIEDTEFIKAREILDSTKVSGIKNDLDIFLYKRTILSYLLLKRIDDAKDFIYKIKREFRIDNEEYKTFIELVDYSKEYYKSFKNPSLSMISGVIPGAGYAMAGRRATGIISFIFVSLLSVITYYSFKTDNKPCGLFLGAATTFFYGGSIIGGYMAVKKYNSASLRELKDSLSLEMDLSRDRENINSTHGVGSVR